MMTDEEQKKLMEELQQNTMTLERADDIYNRAPLESELEAAAEKRRDEFLMEELQQNTMTLERADEIYWSAPLGSELEAAAERRRDELRQD
jgi:hypothetical protein